MVPISSSKKLHEESDFGVKLISQTQEVYEKNLYQEIHSESEVQQLLTKWISEYRNKKKFLGTYKT